ncbi:MAG: flavin reductase family protein [Clostridia bacterium]|nr:flavin reductase family protein [Clostridia bacterium]
MFKEISAKEIKGNLISAIADEYMLITAGNSDKYNMMTASWGFVGEMWGNDCAVAEVRPQRYTMEFIDKSDYFTLSFYGDRKDIHKICGSKSGRDCDKTALTGLTPAFYGDAVYFEEARLVLICRKQYVQKMEKDCFCDEAPLKWYPNDDFHYQIYGKIEKVLVKD